MCGVVGKEESFLQVDACLLQLPAVQHLTAYVVVTAVAAVHSIIAIAHAEVTQEGDTRLLYDTSRPLEGGWRRFATTLPINFAATCCQQREPNYYMYELCLQYFTYLVQPGTSYLHTSPGRSSYTSR